MWNRHWGGGGYLVPHSQEGSLTGCMQGQVLRAEMDRGPRIPHVLPTVSLPAY